VRWRERLAVILGALLPDVDAILGLFQTAGLSSEPLYARFHRVATHSLPGLIVVWLVAAGVARVWPERGMLPTLRGPIPPANGAVPHAAAAKPSTASWGRLLAVAGIAVAWHVAEDWITAWGTLKLLWPFSTRDFQLGRVNSIEPIILAMTVTAWALQQWFLGRRRRRAAWWTAGAWCAVVVLYVWLRPLFGAPAIV
jgi:membrane-bound metal-dependent hydrolase YbcI (DUF457 family)